MTMSIDAFQNTDEIEFLDQEYFLIKYKNKKLKYKYDDVIGLDLYTRGEKNHILKLSSETSEEYFWVDIADDKEKDCHIGYRINISPNDYAWPPNYAHSSWPSINEDKNILPYPFWYFRIRTFIPRLRSMFKFQRYNRYLNLIKDPGDWTMTRKQKELLRSKRKEWDGYFDFGLVCIDPKARLLQNMLGRGGGRFFDLGEIDYNLTDEEISLTLRNTNRYTKKFPLLLGGKAGTINLVNIDVLAEIFEMLGITFQKFYQICKDNKLILNGVNPTFENYSVPKIFEYDEKHRSEELIRKKRIHDVSVVSIRETFAGFAETIVDQGAKKLKTYAEKGIKECPFCAERVKEKAIKCKHCGSDI